MLTCSALTTDGLEKIWQTIQDHRRKLESAGELMEKRRRQAIDWMWALIEDGLKDQFRSNADVKAKLPDVIRAVEEGRISPTAAANTLLTRHLKK